MEEEGEKIVNLNVKLPKGLHEAAKKRARLAGVTLSQAVRLLLAEWARDPQHKLVF